MKENYMHIENITKWSKEDIGPNITKNEFVKTLSELKQGKASGVDHITAELLKNVKKNTEHKRFEIIKKMYKNDNFLEDFAKNKILLISKKRNFTKWKIYRIISFLTHANNKSSNTNVQDTILHHKK